MAGLPTPVSLLGEFHGQWSLEDYNPRGHKESDTLMTNTFPFFTFSLPGTLPVSEVLVEFTRALRCERWTPNWLTQIGKKKKKRTERTLSDSRRATERNGNCGNRAAHSRARSASCPSTWLGPCCPSTLWTWPQCCYHHGHYPKSRPLTPDSLLH